MASENKQYLSPEQVPLTGTREPCVGLIWTENTTALVYSAARSAMCERDNSNVRMSHVKYNILINQLSNYKYNYYFLQPIITGTNQNCIHACTIRTTLSTLHYSKE